MGKLRLPCRNEILRCNNYEASTFTLLLAQDCTARKAKAWHISVFRQRNRIPQPSSVPRRSRSAVLHFATWMIEIETCQISQSSLSSHFSQRPSYFLCKFRQQNKNKAWQRKLTRALRYIKWNCFNNFNLSRIGVSVSIGIRPVFF